MDKVKRIARKAKRELKGNLDVAEIVRYLETYGYSVVLYNTPDGDKEIERYKLMRYKNTLKAFTYVKNARIVFIDGSKHPDDRFYLLLHELGHVLLGHIGDGKTAWRNQILIDIEADAFAYEMIRR